MTLLGLGPAHLVTPVTILHKRLLLKTATFLVSQFLFCITISLPNLAISSWGTIYGNTPQVVVWTTFDSNPIATFIAKGSLYDIQLSYKNHQEKFLDSRKTAKRAPSDLLVLTCGKVGHKTVYGTDGELYLLDLDMH